jgi:hypothetical protein
VTGWQPNASITFHYGILKRVPNKSSSEFDFVKTFLYSISFAQMLATNITILFEGHESRCLVTLGRGFAVNAILCHRG